jgi:hypothetical protein
MMLKGKCPSCTKTVTRLNIQSLEAGQPMVTAWQGVVYLCPACDTVLGAGLDPIAIQAGIIDGLMQRLRSKP